MILQRVRRVLEVEPGAGLMRIGSYPPSMVVARRHTVLSCGCRYMATGEIKEGEEAYCSRHDTDRLR